MHENKNPIEATRYTKNYLQFNANVNHPLSCLCAFAENRGEARETCVRIATKKTKTGARS